jgi:hypothetical protein
MAFQHEEYGNILEFEKQLRICEALELPTPFPCYKAWRPKNNPQLILKIRAFAKQNKPITVRQAYYYLVSQQAIESSIQNYHLTVRLLKKMRLAGIIPFEWIVDETRRPEKTPSWNNIQEILKAAIDQYRSDWQIDQPNYVEVWLEKRSLRRFFYPITNTYDVYLCIGGGYQSYDMIKDASKRFKERIANNQNPKILYFGDLNPSGKDMPRDIRQRLATLGVDVDVKEIALTKQDILDYQLPRNPFKKKDTRSKWYLQKYGITYSVELDALPPETLREKIRQAIATYADLHLLDAHKNKDETEKERTRKFLGIE